MQYSAPSPVIGVKKQLKDMKRFALLLVATLTLTLQVCQRSLQTIELGSGLGDCILIDTADLEHCFHRSDLFGPESHILLTDTDLLVQHQKRIVGIGNRGDELGADCLTVSFLLEESRLGTAFCIEQRAEEVYVPADGKSGIVGPGAGCGNTALIVGKSIVVSALRTEIKRWRISPLRGFQLSLGLLYPECCRKQIGVIVQSRTDKLLQVRVGEHLLPRHVTEGCAVLDNC